VQHYAVRLIDNFYMYIIRCAKYAYRYASSAHHLPVGFGLNFRTLNRPRVHRTMHWKDLNRCISPKSSARCAYGNESSALYCPLGFSLDFRTLTH